MDIHDIDFEYNALPMTAFWDRSYRAFGGGDVLFPGLKPGAMVWTVPAGDFKTRFTRIKGIDHAMPPPFQGFPSLERFSNLGYIFLYILFSLLSPALPSWVFKATC